MTSVLLLLLLLLLLLFSLLLLLSLLLTLFTVDKNYSYYTQKSSYLTSFLLATSWYGLLTSQINQSHLGTS